VGLETSIAGCHATATKCWKPLDGVARLVYANDATIKVNHNQTKPARGEKRCLCGDGPVAVFFIPPSAATFPGGIQARNSDTFLSLRSPWSDT